MNEWVIMNGFRTFLASLQFPDDRLEVAAKAVDPEAIEPTAPVADCSRERTDEQPIAA